MSVKTQSATDHPYQMEFTPKQRENWEEHGRPVVEAMEEERTKEWYIRTFRPKKRNSGMMVRDDVDGSAKPEVFLRDTIEQFEKPRTSPVIRMSDAFVEDDEQKQELEEVAVRIVAAKVKAGELSRGAARRLIKNNRRVANLYGIEA